MLQFSASELPTDFAQIMDMVQKETVIVRTDNRDSVAIISMKDYEQLIRIKNQRLKNMADEIGYEAKEKGLTPEILEDILNSDA